jgi:DNA repair exonuclease SbcCD ATPase subunit
MKKLILIGIGLAGAGAFIGFDAVEAFFDRTRSDVRSRLISPELELQAQIAEAHDLSERCGESVYNGQVALARLDAMIAERDREVGRREKALEADRGVLESRRGMLDQRRATYLIHNEPVSHKTLNRDALLRAKAYATDGEILEHLRDTVSELRVQRTQTAAEIEEAMVEMRRLEGEVTSLKAELENLKARRAVAQTREEYANIFDRSTFDKARDKVAEIRATIAQQNKRLDFYGRVPGGSFKGLVPADVDSPEEDGAQAIAAVLGDAAAPQPEPDIALTANR